MKTNPVIRRQFFAHAPGSRLFTRFLLTLAACFCLIMLPSLSFGQTSTDWTLQKQEGDVKAYAKIDMCIGEPSQTFFVKFENNSTTQTYEIAYELSTPNNPTFPPIAGKIIVSAGNSAEGTCNELPMTGLRIPTAPGSDSLNHLTIKFTLTSK